jgi:type IV pilus assembly protein PilC
MATFSYTARTRAGEKVDGTVEAHDKRSALLQIERSGHVPVSVKEGAPAGKESKQKKKLLEWRRGTRKMSTREVLIFTTELSDLLSSGMTLGNALNCLAGRDNEENSNPVVAQLRDDILQGACLSDAMAKHPGTFSQLYVSMIKAGEAGGAMDDVLRRLVTHYERVQETKEKMVGALVYPLIVMFMGFLTLVGMMIFVIPKFEKVFTDMGQALPLSTKMLIGFSRWSVRYGWLAALVMVFLLVLLNKAIKTERGRFVWDGLKLKLPLVRGIVASGTYANFARTLGSLLSNGVPVLTALSIVEQTVGNVVIGKEIRNAKDRVTDGTTISGPLAAGKIFPRMMTDMLAIGEQTGDMSGSLSHVGRRYEGELDRTLKICTTALEPMLIVVVAVMVGFVAISILQAVFSMTNGLDV